MALIDNAIYVNGHRTESPRSLDETYELLREHDGMAWIGLYRPSPEELRSVADEFGLHPLAAEETVEFGEVHVFIGPAFVVTVRHAENPDLRFIRHRLEAEPQLLCLGPEAVLYTILDEVVDG
jgi:magnesium transporter